LTAEASRRTLSNPKAAAKNLLTSYLRGALNEYRKNGMRTLRQPFREVEAWRKRHRIPAGRILLGEFGSIKHGEGGAVMKPVWRAALIKAIRLEAEKRGYAWAVWSHGGSFAITADDKRRILEPFLLEALGLAGG
jgi:hypothetical protein